MKNYVQRLPGFPERLKQARRAAGLTQQFVADSLGILLRSYQRYERGESEPSLFYLVSLAVVIGVSTDYLLGLTDERRGS